MTLGYREIVSRALGHSNVCEPPPGFIAVIAEKPKAAHRIAISIGQAVSCNSRGVPYWLVKTPQGRLVVVVPAAGHIFSLHTPVRDGYPVYSFEWKPLWMIEQSAVYQRKVYDLLARLLPKASLYVSACDYDIEGSVICYKIIEAFGDPRRALRMKFSTLTSSEIREAFRNLQPLDVEMIEAGMARHELDWLWGINLSRALMDSLRAATGVRRILSAGRVQSPTLKESARRWVSRALHVPRPHVSLTLVAETKSGEKVSLKPRELAPKDVEEARELASSMKGRTLRVIKLEKQERKLQPPPAFNLGDLQHEAYRIYRFSPMRTQQIAEELYLKALISYPRTNSQKLPPSINFYQIMTGLKANPSYSNLVDSLLRETGGVLKPVQGREDDPAHPAIHPTGEVADSLTREQRLVYDLIVRRFLAAFSKPAILSNVEIVARDDSGRLYESQGLEVVEKGWLKYYHFSEPYLSRIPQLRVGDELRVASVKVSIKWSNPPEILTKDALLRWMESVEIGTESTRARIIETLYERGYIVARGRSATVSDLGIAVVSVLEEYVPELVSPELTRKFEKLLEDIRYKRTSRHKVIQEAIATLDTILEKISRNRNSIGTKLALAAGLAKPETGCSICGRRAVTLIEGVRLCEYHEASLRELRNTLPEIARVLSTSCRKALETIATKKTTGVWVLETARYALQEPRLLKAIISSRCSDEKIV